MATAEGAAWQSRRGAVPTMASPPACQSKLVPISTMAEAAACQTKLVAASTMADNVKPTQAPSACQHTLVAVSTTEAKVNLKVKVENNQPLDTAVHPPLGALETAANSQQAHAMSEDTAVSTVQHFPK